MQSIPLQQPSQAVADWRLILDRDAIMDLQSKVRADLPGWHEQYAVAVYSPEIATLADALMDCLPDSIGDEQARLLVAHDTLCGRRGDLVRACLAELADQIRNPQAPIVADSRPLAIVRAHDHALQHRMKQRRRKAGRRSA